MDQIVEVLRDFFQQNGISVFGTAPAKKLEDEPVGHRPSDMLPSAASMVCFGIPIPRGVFLDKRKVNKNYWRMASIYYHQIDVLSSQLAVLLESQNEVAAPVLS